MFTLIVFLDLSAFQSLRDSGPGPNSPPRLTLVLVTATVEIPDCLKKGLTPPNPKRFRSSLFVTSTPDSNLAPRGKRETKNRNTVPVPEQGTPISRESTVSRLSGAAQREKPKSATRSQSHKWTSQIPTPDPNPPSPEHTRPATWTYNPDGDDGPLQRIATYALLLLLLIVAGCVCAQRRETKRLQSRTPPPLQELRFSPDGRYLLAQGDSGVTVLTVRPFAILFRIPADDADLAHFTPDSRQVVFVSSVAKLRLQSPTSPAHLERWNIADHTRAAFTDIPLHECEGRELSPDGGVLACADFSGKLRILDIPSGETLFEKDNFAEPFVSWPTFADRQVFGDPGSATLAFSPDGRFVIAMANAAAGTAVAWDLREKRPVRLEGATKGMRTQIGLETKMTVADPYSATFAFVAPDRLIIKPMTTRARPAVTATLVAFPSGKVLAKLALPPGPLLRATDPGFVLIRPFGEYVLIDDLKPRTAAVEFATGKVIISNAPALDVFGNYYAAERINGEVGLYERGKGIQATVKLERPH